MDTNINSSARKHLFLYLLISIATFAVWIFLLNLLFTHFLSTNYFVWYLKNGTIISIAISFFSLVWQGLEQQKGLLSWHPAMFLSSCFALAAVFYSATAVNMAGPLDGIRPHNTNAVTILETLWDGFLAPVMNLLMGLAVLGWIIFASPFFYVLTLFTGAPARRELRDTGKKLLVQRDGLNTSIMEYPSSLPVPPGSVDASFGVRPFALTNALNALVLFIINQYVLTS